MNEPDKRLVVPNTKWNRTKVAIEIAGCVVGFLFLLRPLIENPRPIRLTIGLVCAAVVIAFFVLMHRSFFSSKSLLEVDRSGIHVHYPLELGLISWDRTDQIGSRSRFWMNYFYITFSDNDIFMAQKSIWSRIESRLYSERSSPRSHDRTIFLAASLLPMSLETFITAVESYRQQGVADGV